jgi:serine phosphatase RsbU (regulator of sigma subunit)
MNRFLGERGQHIALGAALSLAVSFVGWALFTDSLKTGLVRTFTVSLIYALPMLVLSVLIMTPMRKHIDPLRFPFDWLAYIACMVALFAATITVSSGLMVLAQLANPANPWPELKLINRLAFAMGLLFCLGARVVEVVRVPLEKRNRDLEEKIAVQTRERQMLDQDMERAREIQEALFPTELPRLSGCDLAAGCQPARLVGGDYFDVVRVPGNRVAIAVGDVVGKGIGAALLMSNLQAIARSFAPAGLSAAALCAKANEVIAGNIAPGKFITFFCAIVEEGGRKIDYCNAGHNPPIVMRTDGTLERLTEGGPLLGVFPDAPYAGGTASLGPGDKLVLFTDGITEATSAEGEEFGEARLVDAIGSVRTGSAEAVRLAIMNAVRDFAGESLGDDATLVVVTASATSARAARA